VIYKVREKNRAKGQRKGAGEKQDRDIDPAEKQRKTREKMIETKLAR
jgi:hypothetical protein